MSNCDYQYKGKKYSTDRLMRELVKELPSRSQTESIEFLKDMLGMSEDEISIMKGLIDNKSLGRYKADGKIILSDLATVDVAYHEAFHRVWRMYLSPEERLQAIKEVKSRKNLTQTINAYREIYPKLNENDLIEEILADEFADFTLNSNYKTEVPIKNFFQRLWNFLKKLVGLKPTQIQMIYDKILAKGFKGKPKSIQQYFKDADKLIISGVEFSVEQKNELIQVMTQQFIKSMLEVNGDLEGFLKNDGTNVKLKEVLNDYIVPVVIGDHMLDNASEENKELFENLLDAFYEDVDLFLKTPKASFDSSVFIGGMVRNLRLLGLNIKEPKEDETEGALEETESSTREFGASIEVDPKSKMGAKIKLLLSSMTDDSENTNALGFPKPISWTKAFVQIATKMAGIPTSVFIEELKKTNLPYVDQLMRILDTDINFKNKFISTMAMTQNKFLKIRMNNGDIFSFDANSGTRIDKILNEWKNNLYREIEDWDTWIEKVRTMQASAGSTTEEDILEHFGIKLNDQIHNTFNKPHSILDKVARYTGEKPESGKILQDLNIEGYYKDLAKLQNEFEDALDLMVSLGGDKSYTLGQNTQQTTVINAIRYAQSKFTPEMSIEEKIGILKEFAKFQVSEFNVTKLSDGTYEIHNKWLEKILGSDKKMDHESLELVIPYLIETESNDDLKLAKLDESDLMMTHINMTLHGVNLSMKHGDRSTFYAYTFGKPIYNLKTGSSPQDYLNILVDNFKEQIDLEIKWARNQLGNKLPVQYMGKTEQGAFFKEIYGDQTLWEKLVSGEKLTNEEPVVTKVYELFNEYVAQVREYGILDTYEVPNYVEVNGESKRKGDTKYVKGIDNTILNSFGSDGFNLLLSAAFTNEVSNHLFETRFFSGDVRSFKNGSDFFKRLVPQSSTGQLVVDNAETRKYVREQLDQEFEVINPITGVATKVNPALGIEHNKEEFFRAVTFAEREDYKSQLNEMATTPSGKPVISKLTGKQESKLFMTFEHNIFLDFPDMSLADIKKIYEPKFKLYEEKYSKMNENDGISYMTLPAFKNFMIRQGNWPDGMELIYQIEMKIAGLKSRAEMADMEVAMNGVKFKPFVIQQQEITRKDGTKTKLDGWKKRLIGKIIKVEPVHTLKTQFAGYSTPEEYFDKVHGELGYLFNSVFKTSQHLLLPSAIIGTNLQLANFSMLSNYIDIGHMGSANKVGGVDPKLAAKFVLETKDDLRHSRNYINDIAERGLDFYDKDGFFNHAALDENKDILTYLASWTNLKDQVQIGNKTKDEIKGSTQSLKILLSNLIVNKQERFIGAQDLVNGYKEVIKNMVKNNHDNLLKRIGYNVDSSEFENLDQLKKTILESSQMMAAPDNVRNSVENFFNDPSLGLEVMPMKNKIENVLYSLITNGIISFDRPGSSYPQAAITGYEALGSRKFDENGLQSGNQDTLKFYEPVFDEEGNLVKINPAEIILPLPDYWIQPLLRWARTNNLVKALDMLNASINDRPELFQFKGLRIPNQQLSSNDMFQVKKFNLPTMQNYVLVPSEIVIKSGSDYDIDKLNIYWAGDTQNKIFGKGSSEELLEQYNNYVLTTQEAGEEPKSFEEFNSSQDRELLEYEKQIILHPRNAHHLLMPLTDEIFVKDIYKELTDKGVIEKVNSSFVGSMLPNTNVRNAIIFVKGKYGVGPVALGITNSATNQADGLNINTFYQNQDDEDVSTALLFKGMEGTYTLDNYTDNEGTIISEILSQLLTTQVDNVKNPTAVLMNINMQTLGVMLYLIRRKINPKSIVLLLQQPIISEYLKYQRRNESLFNKQADSKSNNTKDKKHELSKDYLIKKLLSDLKYSTDVLPDVYRVGDKNPRLSIDNTGMFENIKTKKFDQTQLDYLAYFMELQSQSRAFSDFQQSQNSDTKGLKDKQMLDESNAIRARMELSQIVTSDDVSRLDQQGVISPFYQYGRQSYNIFNQFYTLSNSIFGGMLTTFKDRAAELEKSDGKDRVRQTIENDFLLFLIHNYGTSKAEFDRLMKDGSVAKRVLALKDKIPSNLVLKAFFPVLRNTTDLTDNKKIDNLRLFEKELNALDSNDMRSSLEEIHDVDSDLYNDIVKLLMFQSGLNISPFNYRSVVPVGLNTNRTEFNDYEYLYQDMIQNAVKAMKAERMSLKQAQVMFGEFKTLFAANNVKFLRKYSSTNYPYPLKKTWERKSKDWVLESTGNDRQTQTQLGNAYHKQYFRELINGKTTTAKGQNKVENKEVFRDDDTRVETSNIETLNKYELFPGVFANKGQTEALDLLDEFLNSKEQEFTLIGRGGTGKTTIIKKILDDNKEKRILGITVAHKAKKVLGKSIGRDKVKTVASALAIKLDETTGNFVPDTFAREQGRIPINSADIIIVDEASMISPNIYREIMSLKKKDAKVIFMGDNAQLPPIGEQEDSPVFKSKNQYTLLEKMRQAKTSPIINVGSAVADNIESKEVKLIALSKEDRQNKVDLISKSQTIFTSNKDQALDDLVEDLKVGKGNPDFVKAITFNNEKHYASQSVKNLNVKIREKLLGEKSNNQFNQGELLTAYDSYSRDIGASEDEIPIHNSDDFTVLSTETHMREKGSVIVSSKKDGRREFAYQYTIVYLSLLDNEGKTIDGIPVIADSSKAQYEADVAKLWQADKQLAFALKNSFANLQYGYAITSHKAQGSTYTNAYVFEDNILGPTNAGDALTKNKSLYVAVSRPTTKLVMISDRNGDSETSITQPKVKKVESPTIKTLPMQPDNIEQIKAGTKTITNRSAKIEDGTYKLPDGTLVEITYVGEAKVTDKGIEINGHIREKDSFAKAEGFKDWNDFKQNNKFSENFINGKQSRFIHKVDTFQSIFEMDKSQSNYSPSLKMYEGFINLNQLYTGEEIIPFIGESEYYRYLVPMLLKMNPEAQTMFTNDIRRAVVDEAMRQDMPIDYLVSLSDLNLRKSVRGASFNTINTNFVKEAAKTKTVIHELVHLTLQKEYEKNGEFKQKIDELYSYSDDRAKSDSYGFSSPKEFLAEAMSNPEFMEELNNIQYQNETVWSYLMTLVSDFINGLLNIELKSDSVLAEVVRQSEQVLNKNITEISKNTKVTLSSVGSEIVENWNTYFPDYSWMNDAQKQMTAKLVEEGKITLNCKF